jgi:sterol desaturase/sphingolipid hydroxylase (fatty acid hydroxylase superfamily)
VLAQFLVAVVATVALLSLMSLSERVAPIERHSLRSKLPGILFTVMGGAITYWFIVAVQQAEAALGMAPLVRVPVVGWLGTVAAVAAYLLAYDFTGYWLHRALHQYLWPVHVLHHCQTELNAANSYGHYTERAFRILVFALPLSVVQFDVPVIPWFIIGAREVLELYIHSPTEFHFGPLRRLMVDNRFHRIHHSLEPRHFDKNFAVLFSFWDSLFGTAYWPSADEWPRTGVAGLKPPRTIGQYLVYPFTSWRLLAPPPVIVSKTTP